MSSIKIAAVSVCLIILSGCSDEVKTTFQTGSSWKPTIDNRADAVMVYGPTRDQQARKQSWEERGYDVHFMTGIAWGEYQDYFNGGWDGDPHFDEGQVEKSGEIIWHGKDVPYIVPTENYLDYVKDEIIDKVIDAGISNIFLEEPEFWARSGYSPAFKREWKEYYGTDWLPQDESPQATYLSNKLKYHLYYRALEECFSYAKKYGSRKDMKVKCYVPTHSLINYSQWQIVSPEASLASLDCMDGYIAQVWTGTSRVPNYYDGKRDERVFETAFLEYASMASMTLPTGRKVFFLTDPIEDGIRDWADYKRNYEATFTAQLLQPQIADYEVMPWPDRIYEGLYRKTPDSEEKAPIPADYASQMQVMINVLNDMPRSGNEVSGCQGIGVLMANSMMFQSFPEHEGYSDPQLSNFMGEALPLLKRGVPVSIVHIENLEYRKSLKDIDILLMSYSNMKPLDPEAHEHIASWVKSGGVLVYCGRDDDPFQTVPEWWNSGDNSYAAPSDHLFSLMNIPAGAPEGEYEYGRGAVCILRHDPKEFVLEKDGDSRLIETVSRNYGGVMVFKNNFLLRRGPYIISAVMTESVTSSPLVLTGSFVDLYDPNLPVLTEKRVEPGRQALLYDLDRLDGHKPQIVASGARSYDIVSKNNCLKYTAKGPVNTNCATRVYLPRAPKSVQIDGEESYDNSCWDAASGTYFLQHPNNPDGVKVNIGL